MNFDVHTISTAPEQSRPTLEGVKHANYTNHIAETPLDDAFAGQAW